jgi:hypothetical protein
MRKASLALAFAVLSFAACGTAKAQPPVPGQPYQVPVGFEAYGPGSVISYGGCSYVIQPDRTMLLSAASPAYFTTASTYSWQPAPTYWYPFRSGWGCYGWGGYRHYYRHHYRCL